MEQNNFSIEIFGSVPLEETIYRACSKQRNDSVAEKKRIEDTVQQLFISLCPRSVHQRTRVPRTRREVRVRSPKSRRFGPRVATRTLKKKYLTLLANVLYTFEYQ